MTNTTATCCPHLGLIADRTVMLSEPTTDHYCYGQKNAFVPEVARQENFCLCANHINCSVYAATIKQSSRSASTPVVEATAAARQPLPTQPVRRNVYKYAAAVTLLSITLVIGLILTNGAAKLVGLRLATTVAQPAQQASGAPPTPTALTLAAVAALPITATPTPSATPTPTALPSPTAAGFVLPTAEAGGALYTLAPKSGNAGWWKDKDTQRNHLDDSYLYAGAYEEETFIAAARFDLSDVPRGAPIRQAYLRLTGLRQDQFRPGAKGIWLLQLLPESSLAALGPADFLTMLSAPAAITLLPPLAAVDLASGRTNEWELEATARQWLEQQLLEGATSITLRIQSSLEQEDALFAWDSGLGPESQGDGPRLLLNIGPPPPTPPPLPTKPFSVATLTPVPQNVLTVVALAKTATAVAVTTGTYTPIPFAIVTPTPFPINLETAQAVASALQLPPVILHTPVPANPAIATRNADYATAVALTTGTFTPVPATYVTPMLIAPSPPAENVATEAARVVAATALANSGGPTATPLAYNAVIGVYVYATPAPANAETAQAEAVIATASAKVNGTPTPLPWNAIVITPIPTPTPTSPPTATPLPPVQRADELTPTPLPTNPVSLPDRVPADLIGKILFKTNRSGPEEIYALDPVTGDLYRINEAWIYTVAQKQLPFSPDGRDEALVKEAADRTLQIHTYAHEYALLRQLTALTGADIGISAINYDPAWSPRGDLIAFVSTNNGNDEIYTVTIDGTVVTQLTNNKFEWDKHPSWSPDGGRIVFFSNRETGRRQLWIMNADGSDQRNLSSNPYEDWDPIWVR